MSTERPQGKFWGRCLKKWKWKWKKIEANTALLDSSAFRWTTRIFVYTAIFYATVVITEFDFRNFNPFSSTRLQELVLALKNPALIVGISLPILGLLASHLRSIQTKKQIETQQEQNVFSNYLAHRGQFNEFMKEEAPLRPISTISKWAMYGRLFPNAEYGDFEIDSNLFDLFRTLPRRLEVLQKELEKTRYNDASNWKILEDLFHDIEWNFREYSQADFSDDLNERLFLSKLEKRIEKHIVCIAALHDCSNFHSSQLHENRLSEVQDKYIYCKATVAPQALRERLLNEISDAALPKGINVETDRERQNRLKGKILFENSCKGGDDHEIVITDEISEVINNNFDEKQLEEVKRILPPVVNVYMNLANSEEQE